MSSKALLLAGAVPDRTDLARPAVNVADDARRPSIRARALDKIRSGRILRAARHTQRREAGCAERPAARRRRRSNHCCARTSSHWRQPSFSYGSARCTPADRDARSPLSRSLALSRARAVCCAESDTHTQTGHGRRHASAALPAALHLFVVEDIVRPALHAGRLALGLLPRAAVRAERDARRAQARHLRKGSVTGRLASGVAGRADTAGAAPADTGEGEGQGQGWGSRSRRSGPDQGLGTSERESARGARERAAHTRSANVCCLWNGHMLESAKSFEQRVIAVVMLCRVE
eukprot:5252021-Prymnesium_polylepis.1